jgi:hypothetical protein
MFQDITIDLLLAAAALYNTSNYGSMIFSTSENLKTLQNIVVELD